MPDLPLPTDRELAILQVLWDRGEATVRQVYEDLRERLPIVQNTVQAFLRTMTEKELVTHRTEGRSFVYQANVEPEATRAGLLERVLSGAYEGAIGRLVEGAIGLKAPSAEELDRLRALLDAVEPEGGRS
ncbi:MAG: BlaI/MecI/CopY family transcriptional regulator [Planctomycetota bacterium]|nr:BlaI/MecI/CopY family transcriptional regulator [Planctomycetota bacterium]